MVEYERLEEVSSCITDSKFGPKIDSIYFKAAGPISAEIDVVVDLKNQDEKRDLGELLDEIKNHFEYKVDLVFHQYNPNNYDPGNSQKLYSK